jgi:hypothetical protein
LFISINFVAKNAELWLDYGHAGFRSRNPMSARGAANPAIFLEPREQTSEKAKGGEPYDDQFEAAILGMRAEHVPVRSRGNGAKCDRFGHR